MDYTSFTSEQSKVIANAIQLFEALEQLRLNDSRFKGSMHWKHINGRDYLYRAFTGGRSQSLGPRSTDTEKTKRQFETGKAVHAREKKNLVERLDLQAAYIRANRLNRFPLPGARIVRAFQRTGVPHRVIGTNALYVYEVAAGVLFLPEHITTEDTDILMDDRQSLRICARLGKRSMLSLIQKTDKSFRKLTSSQHEFCAVNDAGYKIDLLTQGAKTPMLQSEFSRVLDGDDLRPVEIETLKWLTTSPHFSEIVFDEKGLPVRVDTVDPRAFVLYKHFVSKRDDRRPAKRKRDAEHARIVAMLLVNELRHLPKSKAIEKLFPDALVREFQDESDEFSL